MLDHNVVEGESGLFWSDSLMARLFHPISGMVVLTLLGLVILVLLITHGTKIHVYLPWNVCFRWTIIVFCTCLHLLTCQKVAFKIKEGRVVLLGS